MTMDPSDVAACSGRPMIATLERLTLPAHLDGSMLPHGSMMYGLRIDARNDLDAIQMWLVEVANCAGSFRSYRLEAERCLLWSTIERGKPLGALNDEDIRDYARFLLDPQPGERWRCEGNPRRDDDSWRPFRRPLSPRSRDRALGIVASLFRWLEIRGYLPENPWHRAGLASRTVDKKDAAPAIVMERRASIATAVEWSYVRKALDALEAGDECEGLRTRTILYLAYFADLKTGEICSLRTSSIRVLSSGPTVVWTLDIESRPSEIREIILLPPVQKVLEKHLASRGIMVGSSIPEADAPVIASSRDLPYWQDAEPNLSAESTRSSTRLVFLQAAELAHAGGDITAARRLSGATIHWFKHAFEVHVTYMPRAANWCWFLLGACWLAGSNFKAYLPARMPLSAACALKAFEDLGAMWEEQVTGKYENGGQGGTCY